MTIYEELCNSKSFVQARIKEQRQYLLNHLIRRYNPNAGRVGIARYEEVRESAEFVLQRFENRLKQLL